METNLRVATGKSPHSQDHLGVFCTHTLYASRILIQERPETGLTSDCVVRFVSFPQLSIGLKMFVPKIPQPFDASRVGDRIAGTLTTNNSQSSILRVNQLRLIVFVKPTLLQ